MSYILDALKRADAERERAAVPGLHAHPQDGLSTTAGRGRGLPWPALAVGAVVVLGGALAWVLLSDRGVRTPPLVAGAPPSAEAPAPAPTAAPPVVAEPAATPTVVMPPPAPPPAPAPRAPTPAAPAAAAAPGAVATPPVRVPTLAELPAEVRASLPPLAISGAVYSPTPSARLLFIGGQVLREGDAVAEGVVIERIGASASVLSARGQRFEIRH